MTIGAHIVWAPIFYYKTILFHILSSITSTMKKILLSLLTCILAAGTAWGCEVIFDPGYDTSDSPGVAGPFGMFKDNISISISNGLANSQHYRVYKGQTITICSSAGDITNIEFQCTALDNAQYGPGCFVADCGAYSYTGYIGNWQGRAACVTFTAASNQVRITKIIVTYDCNGVSTPVINPASGTYYEPIQVSMSCTTPDAVIYYTTNGSDPDSNSPVYTEPFTASNNMTVKAIAVKDGLASDMVTANYEFVTPNRVGCLGDAMTLPDGEVVVCTNPLTVLAQHGNYLYVKDDCVHTLIYGNCGQTYTMGDIIPGGAILTKTTYSGETEFTYPQGFKPASGNTPVEPEEITSPLGHDLFAHYLLFRDARIVKNGSQYTLIDAYGNEYPIFFGSMGIPAPTNLDVLYDVYAIVGSYGSVETIYQLLALKLVCTQDFSLCDMLDYPDNETITFNHEATVIYQYNRYLYLKDECGFGLVYGDVGQTYNMGDVIPPGWGGTKTTYSGEPEISRPTGFLPATRNEELTPLMITVPQVGHPLWAHYVELHDVYIDQVNMVIRDQNGNTCPYYPQLPYDIDPTITYDIRAIITSYGRTETIYQLFIFWTSHIIPPPPGACCLNDLYLNSTTGQMTEFTCPLTVIYQSGAYLYVKDSCDEYGLIYGANVGPFENGDLIIGTASWTTYQGQRQLSPANDWHKIGKTDPVEPEEMPIEELSHDMVHWYVRLSDVKITFDDNSASAEDETGSIIIYDRFHAEIINWQQYDVLDVNWDNEINIADINALIDAILNGYHDRNILGLSPDDLVPDATYDVDGFISVYRDNLEIFPVRILRHGIVPPPPSNPRRYDVNGDGEVTIADINCIIDWILNH